MAEKVFQMHYDDEKVIRTVCKPVENPSSPEMRQLLADMVEYLKNSQIPEWARKHKVRAGVGLAAPQIGIAERFFAVYVESQGVLYQYGMINPTVTRISAKRACLSMGEGCLSVAKDRDGYVNRAYRITVKGYDALQDKEVEVTLKGYPAIVFQHELDHLDGHLYYDHIDASDPWKENPDVVKIDG